MIDSGIVLRGMGIECEIESYRALETVGIKKLVYLDLQSIVDGLWQSKLKDFGVELSAKTLVWIPGGFSFSDDFGAGRLMSYWLKKAGFLDKLIENGAHLIGVCNGFQVLTSLGVFGEKLSLEPNIPSGFQNKWVDLNFNLPGSEHTKKYKIPVRHAEGRLSGLKDKTTGVEVFLRYDDETFTNGSEDLVAGLSVKIQNSWIFGMMPHPEIALRAGDSPLISGTSRMPKFRSEVFDYAGDGFELISCIRDFMGTGE